MDKEIKKYLICPVCFSIYSLDNPSKDDIMQCKHCEDVDTTEFSDFLYYSSAESLQDLKNDFKRSKHLDGDSKEFIVKNIDLLIELIEEIKG